MYALVDDKYFDKLSGIKWYLNNGYARSSSYVSGKTKNILMHRMIMEFPDSIVDHINGDKLDNRRQNLRECNRSGNKANSVMQKNNKSGHRGVFFDTTSGLWVAQIRKDGNCTRIGYYHNPIDAARSYNMKAQELFGEFARLNEI